MSCARRHNIKPSSSPTWVRRNADGRELAAITDLGADVGAVEIPAYAEAPNAALKSDSEPEGPFGAAVCRLPIAREDLAGYRNARAPGIELRKQRKYDRSRSLGVTGLCRSNRKGHGK